MSKVWPYLRESQLRLVRYEEVHEPSFSTYTDIRSSPRTPNMGFLLLSV